MTESNTPSEVEAQVPVALPDDENPAILDAHKTYKITLAAAVIFIASVFIFVL